jgi:hypothetical protein
VYSFKGCTRPPGLRPRANQRCPETPLWEASDEAGTQAALLSRLAGGPARGALAHGSFFVDFFLRGAGFVVGFRPNLGTPNCGTRQ